MLPCAPRRLSLLQSLLCALLLCAGGCTPKFERPNLTVSSIEMQSGNLLQQNFLVKFQVQNPNDRALPVSGLHADLNVAGQHIASGVSNRSFVVPALGTAEFDMTITANMALVLLQLAGQHTDTIDYEVTGAASLNLPFLHDLPFHQSGSFSLKQFR
jgi:LEA14-like dessication related protein